MRRLKWITVVIAVLGGLALASPAFAETENATVDLEYAGGTSISLLDISGGCCDVFEASLHVGVDVTWVAPARSELEWEPSTLRQGDDFEFKNTFDVLPGAIDVHYNLSGNVSLVDFSAGYHQLIPCNLPRPGDTARSCTGVIGIPLISLTLVDIGLAEVTANLGINFITTVELNSDGAATIRTMSITGGTPFTNGPLDYSGTLPKEVDSGMFIPCTVPRDQIVNYELTGNVVHVSGGEIDVDAELVASLEEEDVITGHNTIFAGTIASVNVGELDLPGFTMTAPNKSTELGTLLPDVTPPTILGVTRGGTMVEGTSVDFTTLADDNCGPETLDIHWQYSDGGQAFGATTHHTFNDNGRYTARVRVTDPASNTTTTDISDVDPIVISNANPAISQAPPGKNGQWGDMLTYHADAIDQGTADQPTLRFTWAFGDGVSASGTDVQHSFAMPGNYLGTVTVTDKDGGNGSAPFQTNIGKRATSLVYNGAMNALANTAPTLSATLTDDHNQPVTSGAVLYTLGGQNATALTSGLGWSALALMLAQAGDADYALTAAFAGDARYLPSGATPGMFRIAKRRTSAAYTGATTGVTGRSVTLSTRIVDELYVPVAGENVNMVLGSQSASAVTDANGLATAVITLNQAGDADYSLTTSYGGSPTNLASGTTGSFHISKRQTTTSYTGPMNVKFNKVAALSATVVDELGLPVAGQLVTFSFGSQTTSAITDATGIAVSNLVITQKKARYTLLTSYAGDAFRNASSSSTVFTVGNK